MANISRIFYFSLYFKINFIICCISLWNDWIWFFFTASDYQWQKVVECPRSLGERIMQMINIRGKSDLLGGRPECGAGPRPSRTLGRDRSLGRLLRPRRPRRGFCGRRRDHRTSGIRSALDSVAVSRQGWRYRCHRLRRSLAVLGRRWTIHSTTWKI